jgi:hypothetical protein
MVVGKTLDKFNIMDEKYIGFSQDEIREDFRKLMVASSSQTVLYALFFAEVRKDRRLLDKLFEQVRYVTEKYQMTPYSVIKDFDNGLENNYTVDPQLVSDIYEEALAELEAEMGENNA